MGIISCRFSFVFVLTSAVIVFPMFPVLLITTLVVLEKVIVCDCCTLRVASSVTFLSHLYYLHYSDTTVILDLAGCIKFYLVGHILAPTRVAWSSMPYCTTLYDTW